MTATQTTTKTETETSTPALALAYFAGYSDGEAYAACYDRPATIREIIETFSDALASRRVARESFRAYAVGWAQAEKMTAVRS